jgi:hypothetical protein
MDSDELTADGSTALDYQEVYCPSFHFSGTLLSANAHRNGADCTPLLRCSYADIIRSGLRMLYVTILENDEN